jgi:hypothetical protein
MDTLKKCDIIRDKITEILDKWRFVEDIKSDCLLIALQKHRPQEEWLKKWVNEFNRFELIRREDNQYIPIKENETITDLHPKNIDFVFRLLDCK